MNGENGTPRGRDRRRVGHIRTILPVNVQPEIIVEQLVVGITHERRVALAAAVLLHVLEVEIELTRRIGRGESHPTERRTLDVELAVAIVAPELVGRHF